MPQSAAAMAALAEGKPAEFAVRMESRKGSIAAVDVPGDRGGEVRSTPSGELSPHGPPSVGAGTSLEAQDVKRSLSRLVMPPSHAPAQWQAIAEGFAATLTGDFVDLVFKVRGPGRQPAYLACHRSLVAAAWPSLREELAGLSGLSGEARDLRKVALDWLEMDYPERERMAVLDGLSWGVLDVTNQPWGSYSILRALLCHLYNRQISVQEKDLGRLRDSAVFLGSGELARCCDEMESRPIRQAWPNGQQGVSRSNTPEDVSADPQRAGSSVSSTAYASTAMEDTSNAGGLRPPGKPMALSRTTSRDSKDSGEAQPGSAATPAVSSRAPPPQDTLKQGFHGEARAMPMAERLKPRGEHSFNTATDRKAAAAAGEEQPSERGSVHRVLSEIKRNIVESSRIIADKTFQQIYEMVPGTRGVLGEGINGPVRMARNRKTGREVAVKRISCVNLSEQRRQMLVSEVRIFLQVSHRNIVQLLEVYESEVDQAVLLVMELCTGRELFERLAERKWYSEFDAARVCRQMLDAVSYLHSQNICHRDLKLENWLYENPSQEARLKLCDFGFGQIVDPNVQLTATLGSLFYVAPEVLEGSYGLPCDMWSLGVIVYMLLSGVPPFDGKTDADVMAKIRQGRYNSTGRRWEGISETAKHFVRSMLRKDPYERLTAAEVAQHAWLKMECQPKLLANPSLWPKNSADPELDCPIDRTVIRDMWNFAQNNAITRAALGLLAKIQTKTSFSGREEDVLLLEQRFKSFDEQGTGKIDAESFIKVLKETLHLQISSAEEKEFFERIAGSIPTSTPEDSVYLETKDQPLALPQPQLQLPQPPQLQQHQSPRQPQQPQQQQSQPSQPSQPQPQGQQPQQQQQQQQQQQRPAAGQNKPRRRAVNYAEFITLTKARRMANNTAAIREAFRSFDTTGEGFVKEDDMHKFLGDEYQKTIEDYIAVNGKDIIDYLHFANIVSQEMAKKEEKEGSGGGADAAATPVDVAEVPPLVELSRADTPGIAVTPPTVASEAPRAGDLPLDPRAVLGCPSGTSEQLGADDVARHSDHGAAEPPRSDDGGNEEEGGNQSEEEEVDDDACDEQSDEEQLVNVVNTLDEAAPEPQADAQPADEDEKDKALVPAKPPVKEHHRKFQQEKKEARFQSFSLSLAGSSEYDDVPVGVNRVASMPSDKYHIKQLPGFHSRTLRPFYASRPVSNIVLGLIRGTSLYAKQSVAAKLATIIHTACGWFFIMPNPKYHTEVDSRKGLLSKETGKFRFVAWWIHPRFVPQCRQWFERATSAGADYGSNVDRGQQSGQPAPGGAAPAAQGHPQDGPPGQVLPGGPAGGGEAGSASVPEGAKGPEPADDRPPSMPPVSSQQGFKAGGEQEHLGSPGDFRFSDVPKPENYLHTYRDLHTRVHVDMLGQLWEGTHRFLRSLFDENFMAHASISAGFHYPVRTQYATLHMQVRVNAGNICGEDGRGMEVGQLVETLKRDRMTFERDSEPVRYQVTENVKVSLLAAASEYEQQNPGESACRQVTPLSYELGATGMPTIHDEEDEDDEDYASKQPDGSAQGDHGERQGATAPDSSPTERESQIAENHEVADEVPASYIINIQPSTGSRFEKLLYENRKKCGDEFGADPTYLYPLHVSVTGFFEASERQIQKLQAVIPEMLQRELKEAGGVRVGKVICTRTGYVLFDMKAAAVSNFSQRLGEVSARQYGLHIRPKAVNHISLACNRPDEAAREAIRLIFDPPDDDDPAHRAAIDILNNAEFDLVLSRLVARSSFERLEEDGPHKFDEVVRIPLGPLLDFVPPSPAASG